MNYGKYVLAITIMVSMHGAEGMLAYMPEFGHCVRITSETLCFKSSSAPVLAALRKLTKRLSVTTAQLEHLKKFGKFGSKL